MNNTGVRTGTWTDKIARIIPTGKIPAGKAGSSGRNGCSSERGPHLDRKAAGTVLLVFAVHILIIWLAGYLNALFFTTLYPPQAVSANLGVAFYRWDAVWYVELARTGYDAKSAAFFPLYPLLMHLLSRLGMDPATAGYLISHFSFLGALAVFYALARLSYDRETARRALWYLALFPTSFFFSLIYTEALYLLLAVTTFYFLHKRSWPAAALTGCLASATRSVGIFLTPAALAAYLLYWWQEKCRRQSRRLTEGLFPGVLWLALMPGGLIAYMIFLWIKLGDPLSFVHAQQFWQREFAWPWESLALALALMAQNYVFHRQFTDFTFTVFALGLLVLGWRRLWPPYTVFAALSLVFPLFSPAPQAPLFSMPRFVAVIFPLYFVLAEKTRSESSFFITCLVFVMLQTFLISVFARGFFVA